MKLFSRCGVDAHRSTKPEDEGVIPSLGTNTQTKKGCSSNGKYRQGRDGSRWVGRCYTRPANNGCQYRKLDMDLPRNTAKCCTPITLILCLLMAGCAAKTKRPAHPMPPPLPFRVAQCPPMPLVQPNVILPPKSTNVMFAGMRQHYSAKSNFVFTVATITNLVWGHTYKLEIGDGNHWADWAQGPWYGVTNVAQFEWFFKRTTPACVLWRLSDLGMTTNWLPPASFLCGKH